MIKNSKTKKKDELIPGIDYYDERFNGPLCGDVIPYDELTPEEKSHSDELIVWAKTVWYDDGSEDKDR